MSSNAWPLLAAPKYWGSQSLLKFIKTTQWEKEKRHKEQREVFILRKMKENFQGGGGVGVKESTALLGPLK